MPERTVHSIVLRRRDVGETDRRLTILTEESGKMDVVAKGARKAASRLAGISDPLTVARLCIAEGKRTAFVTQAQPLASFRGLRTDFERLSLALALVELYAAVCPYEQPFPEAFELLRVSLAQLEKHERPLVAMVWAEVRLLLETGFFPQLDHCVVTEEPLTEAEPYLSPHAGGYVSDFAANAYTDRFRTRAEILYGLDKMGPLNEPPTQFKAAEETLLALLPFWRQIAEVPLPANEAYTAELRHQLMS